MYEYRPPRQNAVAKITVLSLLAVTVLAFVGSAFVPRFPAILQAAGLCFLVPVVQITARYLIGQYLYRVREGENGVDLEVFFYRGGARMQLVCRVGLAEITAVTPLCEQNKKPPHKVRRYNYCPDLCPRGAVVLSVTNGDGDCEILLTPDETLLGIFREAIPPAAADGTETARQ